MSPYLTARIVRSSPTRFDLTVLVHIPNLQAHTIDKGYFTSEAQAREYANLFYPVHRISLIRRP